jgi:hypothetical protein
MSDYIKLILNLLKKELLTVELQKEILQPMIKWILLKILPYIICIIIFNFFLTISAVSLVLYLYK